MPVSLYPPRRPPQAAGLQPMLAVAEQGRGGVEDEEEGMLSDPDDQDPDPDPRCMYPCTAKLLVAVFGVLFTAQAVVLVFYGLPPARWGLVSVISLLVLFCVSKKCAE